MRQRVILTLCALLALAAPAVAQPEVDARRVILGVAGTTCTLRSGSGAPASGLGAVCDVYVRTDAPYSTYRKTGASTWSELYTVGGTDVAVADGGTGLSSWTTGQLVYASGATTLAGLTAVSTGQVLTSAGTSTAPAWSASPSVTALTASGALQGATVTGTTSVSTPTLTASGNLTISPTGDLITTPGGADVLPGTGYATNLGALTRKYLTLHAAELWVETLVAQDTLATIGGRVLVGPTTSLTADLAAAATTIQVKHNQIANGDRLVLQANGQLEWLAVTSSASGSAGAYTYSVTRNLDGTGANDWTAGDAVFNSGTTGDGFIDLYSVSGLVPGSTAGPTIVGNVRTGTTYSQVAPRWAVGNLNGIGDYATDIYGAVFGDPSGTHVTADATYGFRVRNGTTNKLTADTSGNLAIVGDLSVGTAGVIRSGATAYGTGTGYWLDYNSGTPRFRIGTTSGNRLAWDGTDLTLRSANATIDANGVSITPNTVASYATARAYGFTVPSGTMGMSAYDSAGASRQLYITSSATTGGANVSISADSGSPSSTASLSLQAGTSPTTAELRAQEITLTGTYGFRFLLNNTTFGGSPYIRTDGNYFVIESRTTANGGGIYLANDNAANIVMGVAGGTQQMYAPVFVSTAPEWASALTQTTVGAAGAASALPANPVGYLRVKVTGVGTFVVPVYNPS